MMPQSSNDRFQCLYDVTQEVKDISYLLLDLSTRINILSMDLSIKENLYTVHSLFSEVEKLNKKYIGCISKVKEMEDISKFNKGISLFTGKSKIKGAPSYLFM